MARYKLEWALETPPAPSGGHELDTIAIRLRILLSTNATFDSELQVLLPAEAGAGLKSRPPECIPCPKTQVGGRRADCVPPTAQRPLKRFSWIDVGHLICTHEFHQPCMGIENEVFCRHHLPTCQRFMKLHFTFFGNDTQAVQLSETNLLRRCSLLRSILVQDLVLVYTVAQ